MHWSEVVGMMVLMHEKGKRNEKRERDRIKSLLPSFFASSLL